MMTPVMMLQLVPTIPTDPAAAPDPATVVSGIMDQVILAAAPQVHAAGLDLWRGLAAILIVWTGLRIAFTGDFRPWDIVRVVIAPLVSVGNAHLLSRSASRIDPLFYRGHH